MRQTTLWLIISMLILAAGIWVWMHPRHHLPSPAVPLSAGSVSSAQHHNSATKPAAKPHAKEPLPATIGVATMTSDGTIVLDLRAEGPAGMIGDSHLLYRRTDRRYAEILNHLGGLRPGEHKSVPPWPDQK